MASSASTMGLEDGFNGDANSQEPSTSKGLEVEKVPSSSRDGDKDSEKSKGDEKTNTVPFYKLFAFADSLDILLMIFGSIGALGNGVGMPIMTILFGDLVDSFGQNESTGEVVDIVSKVISDKFLIFR